MMLSSAKNTSGSKRKISARFRNTNIVLFILASALIISVALSILKGITDTVSKDYALLYSTNTSGELSAYLSKDIALVGKAARSEAVTAWFADESNEQKKSAALDEMLEIIDGLSGDNMYLAIESSLKEYTVEKHFTVDDMTPFGTLIPDYYDDAWYFECRDSSSDYLLNVDIDKILHRKLVWLNYSVNRDGVPLGVLCTGVQLADKAGQLLAEYDNSRVRGVIIDSAGIVQMDSASLGKEDFLRYEQSYSIKDEFEGTEFKAVLEAYLESIDGYFEQSEPVITKLSGGIYSYATISPIKHTDWLVVTFYNSSSLFNTARLLPLLAVVLAMLIGYALITGAVSYRLLFRPIEQLIASLAQQGESKGGQIYGAGRGDEIGELSHTIQSMKDRLDSYNTDLEKEVEARSADLMLAYEQTREKNDIILSSMDYASKIQRNLLPERAIFDKAFSDYSVLWSPRDIVGGDIYWIKTFDKGTVLCVCDCTGHGTPGALLTMLVVSALEAIVNSDICGDTALIMTLLDQKLSQIQGAKTHRRAADIRDGCDIAIVFVSGGRSVTFSSANTHIIVCDGSKVTRLKGQRLRVGEGVIRGAQEVGTTTIPANPLNKYYIASDGLFDQIGGELARPFGYRKIESIILENHAETQARISGRIWEAFEAYRADHARRDDAQLITFMP